MELSTSTHADALTECTAPRAKLDGKSALDHLFNRLDGMYLGKWRTYFPSEQSVQNWKDECDRVFAEERVTPAHLAVGLRECRRLYDLLSNADMVRRIVPDGHEILPVAQLMVEAIAAIQERAAAHSKLMVTGDDFRALSEGVGRTMDYVRGVPNVAIDRAARAAVAEFNRTGALRVCARSRKKNCLRS